MMPCDDGILTTETLSFLIWDLDTEKTRNALSHQILAEWLVVSKWSGCPPPRTPLCKDMMT